MPGNSFVQYKKSIEVGDIVVAFSHPECASIVVVKEKGMYQNKYGTFSHESMLVAYGTKIASTNGKGFIYLLHPTPELWTSLLPHRTQILYQPDIALISSFLQLEPGVKMLECGTGSGSFSHSISRAIQPTGHLYTFEYHSDRAMQATSEFLAHGIADLITVECRDVCTDGFNLVNKISSAFLDLPSPWEAIPHLIACFDETKLGRVCSFSPCIEQVQATVTALDAHGFFEIKMFEVLQRSHEVKKIVQTEWVQAPVVKKSRDFAPKSNIVANSVQDAVVAATEYADANENNKRIAIDEPIIESVKEINAEDVAFILGSRCGREMRGHTSYLTFAKYLPAAKE